MNNGGKRFNPRKKILSYWWNGEGNRNFGDLVTPYLIEKMTGGKVFWCNPHFCLKKYYVVTGSVLQMINRNAIVWGAGILFHGDKISKPKQVLAVRGPLSRNRILELGYDCPEIYGDPALLLPQLYTPKTKKEYEVGIIPHYVDYEKVKGAVKAESVLVINVFDHVEKVVDDINRCKRTISSSLHGIITSHAYEIPSIWVRFSDQLAGQDIKFEDYFLSVKIDAYKPFNLTSDIPELKGLLDLFKGYNKPVIDTTKLMSVCPFVSIR